MAHIWVILNPFLKFLILGEFPMGQKQTPSNLIADNNTHFFWKLDSSKCQNPTRRNLKYIINILFQSITGSLRYSSIERF